MLNPEYIWMLSDFTAELMKAPMSNHDKIREYDKFAAAWKERIKEDEKEKEATQ